MRTWTGQWSPVTGWSSPFPGWDSEATLVTAFGGPELLDAPGPIAELVEAHPRSVVVGCSTSGEILGEQLCDGTLTVSVTRFETSRVHLAAEAVAGTGCSRDVGARLVTRLRASAPDLRAVFVLSDGLVVNGSELTRGMGEAAGPGVVVTGGLAGDGDRFGRTWVLHDGTATPGVVTAVGLAGDDLRVGHGSRGGWDILGPERRVTRSEGAVLFEIDGQPALDLYRSYLGERASGLPATALLFPLAVRAPGAEGRQVVRTILGVDEEARSLRFAGDVPQESLAQLMRANVDRIVDGAGDAAEQTGAGTVAGEPLLALAISCVGRRLLLGQRTEDELEALVSGLPAGADVVGFYSYGEISPVAAGTCDLHNQTMTVTTVQEVRRG